MYYFIQGWPFFDTRLTGLVGDKFIFVFNVKRMFGQLFIVYSIELHISNDHKCRRNRIG